MGIFYDPSIIMKLMPFILIIDGTSMSCTIIGYNGEQVDITISKNQVLQILYLV